MVWMLMLFIQLAKGRNRLIQLLKLMGNNIVSGSEYHRRSIQAHPAPAPQPQQQPSQSPSPKSAPPPSSQPSLSSQSSPPKSAPPPPSKSALPLSQPPPQPSQTPQPKLPPPTPSSLQPLPSQSSPQKLALPLSQPPPKLSFGALSNLKKLSKADSSKIQKSLDIYITALDIYNNDSPIIKKLEETPPDFYETLEKSLETAEFVNIKSMMKYSREIARLLEKQGLLNNLKMTQADAMALSMYTYDNGEDHFEENPYRIINKTLAERNTGKAMKLRGYILRLLAALRKLPGYEKTKTLYRAVTNVSENYKKVGNVLNWSAFTSTSSDEKSVIDFFNKIVVDGDRYILEITGCFKNGHSIRDFSFHSDEDEILFEPETKFIIRNIEPDTKVDGVTRIHVEVLDTPNILAEVVENFKKKCEENADKENFTNELMNSGEKIAPYGGPVVPKAEWHGFWDAVKKAQTRYIGVKEALGYMGNDALREVLVDGYKTALIDDEYCEGAEMMKGYYISVEEGAVLYSYTYKYGESSIQGKMSPSCAVDGMVREWLENPSITFNPYGTNYLLHIASVLEKLPMLVANNNEQKGGKRIYLCMKEDAAKALRAGEEYVLGSVFVGCAVRPSAGEGECVVCVEDAQLLCVREVGPLSAWGKGGYLLGLPGARIAVVTEFDEGDRGKDVVVRGVPVCEGEKGSYSGCVEHFTFMIPLPEHWSIETEEDSGRIFYQDNEGNEPQWVRPVVEDPGFFTDFGPATTPSQNVMSQPAQGGNPDAPQPSFSCVMPCTNPSQNPQGNPQKPAHPVEQQCQQPSSSQVVKSSPTANNINTPSPQQNINSPTSPLQKNIIMATPPQNAIAGSSPNTQNFKVTTFSCMH